MVSCSVQSAFWMLSNLSAYGNIDANEKMLFVILGHSVRITTSSILNPSASVKFLCSLYRYEFFTVCNSELYKKRVSQKSHLKSLEAGNGEM